MTMRRILALLSLLILFVAQPAVAQSILRDAESEALFNDMSADIIRAAGLEPRNVRIVLISDPSVNAFVAGGQIVYLHSGLIDEADTANEVQGVIAHEIGHIVGGHVPLMDRGFQPAMGVSIVSLLLGVAAMAAGAGEAGAGILAMGQRAALGTVLAFTRTQESAADAAGARFLNNAGVSGKGMIGFFQKLQNTEYRLAVPQDNAYERTHPMSGQRISNLRNDLQTAAAWNKPNDADIERRFKRVQAKLRGYVNEPERTLRLYPASDTSAPARYARAYAYHKSGYPQQAAAETMALVASDPDDPYFLELEGQILLESGKTAEALVPLREAAERTRSAPLIASTLGHALLATENEANLAEAERVLKQSVSRDRENPFAWVQLGTVYERKGDGPRAALATAERASLMRDPNVALVSAERAMAGLPQGSAEWIRAQDIQMVSKTALAEDKRRRR